MVILERGFDIEEPSIELFNHQSSTSSLEVLYYLSQINSRKLALVDFRSFKLIPEVESFILTY